jgi:hypothetical protein
VADSAETLSGSPMLGFNKLSIVRQIGLMVGLAASVAIGFAVVLWSQKPDQRVLFSNLNFSDANQIIEQLRLYNVPYKFDADGRAILVPDEYVHQARLKLASEGFTADKTVGFEILDREQSLGTSQFMETTKYRRGLEGELARTISSMTAVRNARNFSDQKPLTVARKWLREVPPDAVGEIHLAGFSKVKEGELIIDDHSQPVSPECWLLYRDAVALFGAVTTLIEWDNNLPSWSTLLDQAAKARSISTEVHYDTGRLSYAV